MAKTQNKILKWNVNIYLLDWVSRWTFLLPTVQASSIGIRKVPKTGGYVCCLSVTAINTPLSTFALSGLNPPYMTEVALGEGICACIFQGTVSLYYNYKLFNLHNWNFSLWGALPAMAMWVTSVRVNLLLIPVSGEAHRPSVRLITSTKTLFLHLWTPFQKKCIK